MKIMVYYLAIDIVGPTRDQRVGAAHQAQLKLEELQTLSNLFHSPCIRIKPLKI
jgi:hypothetical protein